MYLLEVSWEVCNKVGGIHTVIATKAASLVQAHGDKYVTFGPWLNASAGASEAFEPEAGHEALIEACRRVGVPRPNRWSSRGQLHRSRYRQSLQATGRHLW